MKEKTFNIFMFVGAHQLIREMGYVVHEQDGSDEDKIKFLQSRANDDFQGSKRVPIGDDVCAMINGRLQKGIITWPFFRHLQEMGMQMQVLEPIFEGTVNLLCPLMVITAIVNGKPLIEGFINLK